MTGDLAREVRDALRACPDIPPTKAAWIADQARNDAMDLAVDVRDLDPRHVWGRLALWNEKDPVRLYAVCVVLAAMVPTDVPVGELLAWTEPLRVITGGVA